MLFLGHADHDDRKPLSRWIESQANTSKVEAQHLLAAAQGELKRQDRLRLRVYYAPAVIFIYLMFVRALLLDGWPGWYYAFQRVLAETLLSLNLLARQHDLGGTDE